MLEQALQGLVCVPAPAMHDMLGRPGSAPPSLLLSDARVSCSGQVYELVAMLCFAVALALTLLVPAFIVYVLRHNRRYMYAEQERRAQRVVLDQRAIDDLRRMVRSGGDSGGGGDRVSGVGAAPARRLHSM